MEQECLMENKINNSMLKDEIKWFVQEGDRIIQKTYEVEENLPEKSRKRKAISLFLPTIPVEEENLGLVSFYKNEKVNIVPDVRGVVFPSQTRLVVTFSELKWIKGCLVVKRQKR